MPDCPYLQLNDPKLLRQMAYVDGKWISAESGAKFSVIDPATEQEIGKVPEMNAEDVKTAADLANEAFKDWSKQTAKRRHDLLKKWHALILENQNDLATILTLENGKPLQEALGEIKYGASFIEWFAEEAIRVYGDVIPSPVSSQRFIVVKQPIGVVGLITPWNFPNAMITRKAGAALAAGCTVVVKPGAETPFSALVLAELADRAGIPKGVFNVVTAHENVQQVGEEMCTNPTIKKISFTGSTAVGKLLMKQSASTLKKVTLELGGNAPFIVFDDADIDAAVDGAIQSKFRASGQTCICANRIYVQSSILAEFACRLAEKVGSFKLGNGLESDSTHGPLINKEAIEKVKLHVEDAVAKGAEIIIGGTQRSGNFFHPTVLTGMTQDMLISSEETFGPVAALYKFETEEEVIGLANATSSGLAGYFYSGDVRRCWRLAEALEVGMVGVNTGAISTCEAPFGGIKESGIGREGSKYGIEEYLNIKYINFGGL
ncbi:6461_t:CDS:2 [Paraglomus occultum]|uniref:Succinate-semialdehyde dehydrogenase n=1 Tax=Paraglomus occultum TaxID=144539 RepID=A0A9N8W4U6_9GLOM|nr:6461_t:CDS:2 [Paraglomus occultum]